MSALKPVLLIRRTHDFPVDYQSAGAAGIDLPCNIDFSLYPNKWKRLPTGLFIEVPAGYVGKIHPRSGLADKHGVTVLNAPGTIDCDYRGEVLVLLINHGPHTLRIRRGDRIAQLLIEPVVRSRIEFAAVLSETERGEKGIGSTGVASAGV